MKKVLTVDISYSSYIYVCVHGKRLNILQNNLIDFILKCLYATGKHKASFSFQTVVRRHRGDFLLPPVLKSMLTSGIHIHLLQLETFTDDLFSALIANTCLLRATFNHSLSGSTF